MAEVCWRGTVKNKNLINHVKNSDFITGDGDSGKVNVLERLYLCYEENKVERGEN